MRGAFPEPLEETAVFLPHLMQRWSSGTEMELP